MLFDLYLNVCSVRNELKLIDCLCDNDVEIENNNLIIVSILRLLDNANVILFIL